MNKLEENVKQLISNLGHKAEHMDSEIMRHQSRVEKFRELITSYTLKEAGDCSLDVDTNNVDGCHDRRTKSNATKKNVHTQRARGGGISVPTTTKNINVQRRHRHNTNVC